MGNAAAPCTEATFADSAATTERSESFPSSARAAHIGQHLDDASSHKLQRTMPQHWHHMDMATATPIAVNTWLPVHEARQRRRDQAEAERHRYNEEGTMLDYKLRCEAEAEASLRAAHSELYEELMAAEDEAAHESDLREVLLAELAEREPYGTEMHARLLNAQEAKEFVVADITNLRVDIEKLRPEIEWARGYAAREAAKRQQLRSEVMEADSILLERRRDLHAVGAAGQLLGHDLLREEKSAYAAECSEAAAMQHWTAAVAEMQLQRSNLQMQLMREEHMRQAAANDLDTMRSGPGRPSDIKELVMLV